MYLVYVLEILKFRRLDAMRLRLLRPDASAAEIEQGVVRDLETGEIDAVSVNDGDDGHGGRRARAGLSRGSASGRWMRTA